MSAATKDPYLVSEIFGSDLFGEYQILGVLGRGRLGTTYHVYSTHLGKEFALKSLNLTDEIPLEWVERLEAQTALLEKLVYPHIDTPVNTGRWDKFWFCLKDFVHDGDGNACNLREYMRRHGGQLSHYQVFYVALQMLSALEHTATYEDEHHSGLHHGNLKPENVLMAYSLQRAEEGKIATVSQVPFEVRVSDFQPYNLYNDKVILSSYSTWLGRLDNYSARITERAVGNTLVGIYRAFDYQAPEVIESKKLTTQMDVYSFGAIVYEMLTGNPPSGRFPMPSSLRPELPEYWDEVLRKCLSYYPEDRYDNFETAFKDIYENLNEEAEAMKEASVTDDAPPIEVHTLKVGKRDSLTPQGMVYIPAGTFFVGSEDAGEDALPMHESTTEGFYMDRTPVTNKQFRQFVDETGYETIAEKGAGAPIWIDGEWRVMEGISWKNPTGDKLPDQFDYHPVVQVMYEDAVAYADWLGRRLPTEQEWEYAARGGQKDVRFPWGAMISRAHANYGSAGTCEVMNYQANGYGLYDISGNVWEWTDSWYEAYPGNEVSNANFGKKYRVVRGGSWMNDGYLCMASYRNANLYDKCYPTVGFRTVKAQS